MIVIRDQSQLSPQLFISLRYKKFIQIHQQTCWSGSWRITTRIAKQRVIIIPIMCRIMKFLVLPIIQILSKINITVFTVGTVIIRSLSESLGSHFWLLGHLKVCLACAYLVASPFSLQVEPGGTRQLKVSSTGCWLSTV